MKLWCRSELIGFDTEIALTENSLLELLIILADDSIANGKRHEVSVVDFVTRLTIVPFFVVTALGVCLFFLLVMTSCLCDNFANITLAQDGHSVVCTSYR